MGKWKKWLSAGLFTAMLGTAIIAGPTADVSANAGNKPYNIENVSPDAHLAPSVGDSSSKTSSKAWHKIDGVCYNGSGKKVEGAITRGMDVSEWQERSIGRKPRKIWILPLCVFPMEPDIWMIIMPII